MPLGEGSIHVAMSNALRKQRKNNNQQHQDMPPPYGQGFFANYAEAAGRDPSLPTYEQSQDQYAKSR